jgi:Ca2+-binding RTX toxin-like protein
VDSIGDVVSETSTLAGEVDELRTTVRYTLPGTAQIEILAFVGAGDTTLNGGTGALGQRIIGAAGNDFLEGGGGADTLVGGAGNDVYFVETASDLVQEAAGDGGDTVIAGGLVASITLGANVEGLWLGIDSTNSGTGNELGNAMLGNFGANGLFGLGGNDRLDGREGADTLDGGSGADTMIGGLGNDVFVVDSVADLVLTDDPLGGKDEVRTVLSSYALPSLVTRLTWVGSGAASLVGNAEDNVIATNNGGGSGAQTLDGGAGADTLRGGDANDVYIVDSEFDRVDEGGGGADTVRSSAIRHTLDGAVEVLVLTGVGNINGTGNTLNNTLSGNLGNNVLNGDSGADSLSGSSGADTLNGGLGTDTLNGGTGNDVFLFDVQASGNADTVSGYTPGGDRLAFDMSVLKIGNEDTTVAFQAVSGTWTATAEVVSDITNLAGLDLATIGTGFSNATTTVAFGRRVILIAESTTAGGSGIYLFTSDGDADVETAELVQLAFLPGIFEVTAGDFLFVP